MTLHVYTARIGKYKAVDALDITRKSAKEGIIFAPSWDILSPILTKRKNGTLTEADWGVYAVAFLREMRASFRANEADWRTILARETATLLCYCTDPERCHRTLVAKEILPKLGAVYEGER